MEIQFANRLKSLRKEFGMQQKDLAQLLGTTQRKVSYWETGMVEPDMQTLWEISNVFDVSIDYLVGKKDY